MMNKNATVLRSWQVSRKRSSSSSSNTIPSTKNRPDPEEPTRPGNKNKQFQPTKQPTVIYQPTVSSQFQPNMIKKKQFQPAATITFLAKRLITNQLWLAKTGGGQTPTAWVPGKFPKKRIPDAKNVWAYLPTFWEVLGGKWW